MNVTRGLPKDQIYCNVPFIRRQIFSLLNRQTYDAIIQTYWYSSVDIPAWPSGPLKVLDSHDMLSERYERTFRSDMPRWKHPLESFLVRAYKKHEAHAARCFDHVLAVTDHDKALYDRITHPEKVLTIPSGIEIRTRGMALGENVEPHTVAFFGAMKGSVNLDAVAFLTREVFPWIRKEIPGARLKLVGSDPAPEVRRLARDPNITITGFVDNPFEVLSNAAVAVMPLKSASGFRARLVELMASRVPVVATTVSVQGMEVEDGVHLLIADDPQSFARCVVRLMREKGLRQRMTSAAFDLLEEKYSVEVTLGRYVDHLADLLEGGLK